MLRSAWRRLRSVGSDHPEIRKGGVGHNEFVPVSLDGAAGEATGEAAYQALARQRYASTGVCGPHCDDQVLHAPGECEYCDAYPELQAARQRVGVNYTGHSEPGKRPCFAERRRPVETIHRWGGNVPQTAEDIAERDAEMAALVAKYHNVLGTDQ